MGHDSSNNELRNLYESSWTNAQGGIFAFDAGTGIIIKINPMAETLSGYSSNDLVGKHITMVHLEDERERVKAEILNAQQNSFHQTSLHIQRKDGRCLPVLIRSTKPMVMDDRTLLVWLYVDNTYQIETEHRLSAQNWALDAYAHAAFALGREHTSEKLLLQAICKAITSNPIYVLAWAGIAEDGPGKPIRIAGKSGSAQSYLEDMHLSWSEDEPMGQGPTGISIRTQQVQIVNDTENSETYNNWVDLSRVYGIHSCASIPFATNGSVRGALVVYASQVNAFEPAAIEVFSNLAKEIGHGIHAIIQERHLQAEQEHANRAEKQLTQALSAMVAPIVTAMEMRDPYTAGHQNRVAEIAVAIGREMGWAEERLQGLRLAAQVHDIGKISIPVEILTKPGHLNEPERAMINSHSENGYAILKGIPFAWPIAEIVRQHHEMLDGSGYPRGLKGDEILPEAKVLAVADMVEAMASHRPYRPGIKLYLVLQQIQKVAGSQLDADAVQVCLTLFRDKHLMFPEWIR